MANNQKTTESVKILSRVPLSDAQTECFGWDWPTTTTIFSCNSSKKPGSSCGHKEYYLTTGAIRITLIAVTSIVNNFMAHIYYEF